MKILRIKMLLIFAAISLIAAVSMRLFNAFFFERNPAAFFVGIAAYGIAFALALAAACVLLLLSSLSLGPAIARISSGSGLEDAQKEKTRTALRRTENLIFWLNAVLFLACPLVERGWDVLALKLRPDWFESSLYLLMNVTIGFMAALMERSLCDWLFQELRDRLGFTRVGDRRGEIQIKQRLLVTGFAAMFLSATLSSLAAIGFYREISAWISTASSQGVFSGQGSSAAGTDAVSAATGAEGPAAAEAPTDAVSAASGEYGAAESSEGAAAKPETDAITAATALSQQAFASNTLRVVWQMGLVVFIVLVWGMCLMLSCARLVVRQLSELTRRMAEIGSGSGDLTSRASVSRFDEIGDLTQAFNSTMDNLLALVCRVRAASDRVSQSTSELLGYAEESKQSVSSMDGSAQRMEGILASQDGVIHEASTAIGQLTASIDSVSGSLETQARFVDSSSAAVNRISESIKEIAVLAEEEDRVSSTLSGNSSKGAGAMSDMIASMSGIEGSAASVSSAVQAISRIAAQTNLLAMNAAIEAAHAGDSGRGFAIVADEVRNLAESSARSTKEIVAHIKDMEGKIKRGAELASQAGKAFEDISRDIAVNSEFAKSISAAMREENAGIQEVLSSVEALIRATREIERMTVEQHGCSGRMSKTIDDIVENAKTISRALGEQRAASESLGGLVARVCQKTEESSGVVGKLMEAVGGFKTGEGGESPLRA